MIRWRLLTAVIVARLLWSCCIALGDYDDLQPATSGYYVGTYTIDGGADAAFLGIDWGESPGWQPLPSSITFPDPSAGTTWLLGDDTLTTDYWIASGTAGEYYYYQAIDGTPDTVYAALADYGVNLQAGTIGSLATNQYAFGDNDAIGEDRMYVRLDGDIDPDTLGPSQLSVTVDADDLTPVALWGFNETTGQIYTDSVNGIAFTGVSTTAGEQGIWDYAASIAQGGYMVAAKNAAMDCQDVTVSMWVWIDHQFDVSVGGTATLVGRAGITAPWKIALQPPDVDHSEPYLALVVRQTSGTVGEYQVRLYDLYSGSWNNLLFSFDHRTGALIACLNGHVASYEHVDSPTAIPSDAGGMIISADAFPWKCTELMVAPVALGAEDADRIWRRGVTGSRFQVSVDNGTTWTDANGVEDAYIYDHPASLVLSSLTSTLMFRAEMWSYDWSITPEIEGITMTYGDYPQGPCVITVHPAEFGAGMPVSLDETFDPDSRGSVRYRVSPDGVLWYFFDGVDDRWELAATATYIEATTNTAAEISANFSAFPVDIPTAENVYLQAFLVSDRLNQVELDSMSVTYVAGSVVVDAPDADTVVTYGDVLNISWTPAGTVSGSWDLYYSVDDGSTWSTIATGRTGTSYAWTVPAAAESSQARVRVVDHSTPLLSDRSDRYVVQRPAILWEYPESGQRLLAGVPVTLQWSVRAGVTPSASCVLEYSTNGVQWTHIDTVDGSALEYEWTPPATNADITLRFRDPDTSSNVATVDVSLDAGYLISVQSKIYASAPATITWQASAGTPAMVDLAYSTDAGLSWTYIDRVASVPNATNTYAWRTPNTPASVRVRVSGGGYSDTATATLSGIVLTAPAEGDAVTDQSTVSIAWRSYGAGATVAIQYATSESLALEPGTWITLAAAAPNQDGLNAWSWAIDAMPTTRARIRVISTSDIHLSSISREFTLEVAP